MVEILSPSDRLSIVQAKMQEYLDNGARLRWLFDPANRIVYVYRPNQPVERLENPATISGDPVLPGFVLALERIGSQASRPDGAATAVNTPFCCS